MLGVNPENTRPLTFSDGDSKYLHEKRESGWIDDYWCHRGTSRDAMVGSGPRNRPDRSHFVCRRLRTDHWQISGVDDHRCDSLVRGKCHCLGGVETRESMMIPLEILSADHCWVEISHLLPKTGLLNNALNRSDES
jgi:hypothetical protein